MAPAMRKGIGQRRPERVDSGPGLLSGVLALPGMRAVVLGASRDPNAKLTILLIPPGSTRPALVAKVPLTEGAAACVERERRILLKMHELVPYPILATLPRFVDMLEFESRPALVVSAVPGTPMTTLYHAWRHTAQPSRVAADFAAVESWLTEFQAVTAGPPEPLDMDGGTTDALHARFPDDPCLEHVLTALAEVHSRLGQSRGPRTAVQGDLWCGNLLVAGGQVSGVVDWEASNCAGEPLRDLVHFPLSYALYLDRHTRGRREVRGHRGLRAGTWGAGIEYAINRQGWFPELFQTFIRTGLQRLGADPDRWQDAALAGIARIAAMADHGDFARHHLHLLGRLTGDRSRLS
jgi:hypothetical protein